METDFFALGADQVVDDVTGGGREGGRDGREGWKGGMEGREGWKERREGGREELVKIVNAYTCTHQCTEIMLSYQLTCLRCFLCRCRTISWW